MIDGPSEQITRLIGIYHAKGTALGEMAYWLKARVGAGHCALCDITHGVLREKAEWRQCRDELPIPVETLHLDQRSARLQAFTDGSTPCVVAETSAGFVLMLGPDALAACAGSPPCLVEAITTRAAELNLRLV